MANDGTVKIGTELDKSGLSKGLSGLGGFAKKGFSVVGDAAVSAAKMATEAIAGVSAALGTGVVAAIKVGASFEAEMSKVSAISGATGEDLAALTEKAKEMGAKTKFSASESAQAMEYMAMAGWKTQDMLGGIEGIMNLAAASGEDLATTSDIVTDALTAFGLSASDSGRFADILAAASSNANTNVGMMGETFKYVAPVAGALGFSAEDCAVAIGLMANSGIKASQAGTSLRGIMSRLVKPTKESGEAMEALGLSVTDASGQMKPLNGIIGDMRGAFSGLSEAEKASMAAMLGGQEAMSGLLAIVNASDADFEKLTKSINECDGAAAGMAQTMQDNLQGQITILKSSLEGLGIELHDSMKETLTGIAKAGIEAVNELTNAFKSEGIEGLIEAGSNILSNVLIGIANALPDIISTAAQVIQSVVDNLNAHLPEVMGAGAQILSVLVSGIASLLGSIGELAFNIISTLASELTNNMPQILSQGGELIKGWIDAILGALPTVVSAAGSIMSSLLNGIAGHTHEILSQAVRIITQFASTIIQNLPAILQTGAEIIGKLLAGILQSVPDIIAAVLSLVVDIGKAFLSCDWLGIGLNIIKGIASGIVSAAGNLVNAAVNAAKSAIDTVKGWLGIHSPSRRARDEIGKNMIAGIGEGVEEETPNLEQTSEKSVRSAVKAMKGVNASEFVSNIQQGTYSAADAASETWGSSLGKDKSETPEPAPDNFDYGRMGEEMKKAIDGTAVVMDGRVVGKTVTPYVNDEMGKIDGRKT